MDEAQRLQPGAGRIRNAPRPPHLGEPETSLSTCSLHGMFKMSRPTSLKTLTRMWIGQHGGTPNLSKEVRAIPHPGTFWAPWYRGGELTRNLP